MTLPIAPRYVDDDKINGYSRTYVSWASMKTRCSNPNNPKYYQYAGRGIHICIRWLNSFDQFYADMGERPEGMTLDRIKNHLGYSPYNCRWATPKTQAGNRSSVITINHEGEDMCLSKLSEKLNIPAAQLYYRHAYGLPLLESTKAASYKNIEIYSSGRCRVRVKHKGKRISKTFDTLEEALSFRDNIRRTHFITSETNDDGTISIPVPAF